jgi:hypothetical protein
MNIAVPELNRLLGQASSDDDCWGEEATFTVKSIRQGDENELAEFISMTKSRHRFRINSLFEGSMMLITYDILEDPADPEEPPFLFSQDNTIEWNGPGTGDQENDSWYTEYITINPPDNSGSRRIVNIRFISYSGTKYGVKPAVMGEVFTDPEE